MPKRRKSRKKLDYVLYGVAIALAVIIGATAENAPTPQRSCRDHYLNGRFQSAVLPLGAGDSIFRVECEFPEYSSQSYLSVVTVVHHGLEQWLSLNNSERRTVKYQISDWSFLRTLVAESTSCFQNLFLDWDALTTAQSNEKNNEKEFHAVALNGVEHSFSRKQSNTTVIYGDRHYDLFRVEYGSAPLVHLLPNVDLNSAAVRLSPLRCRRPVIARSDCLFELYNSGSLWIDVKASSKTPSRFLSFSFRADRPNTPFFSVRTANGKNIGVDIIDGYLISVNHIIHPVGLLADGNWHRITIDLIMLSITVDASTTSISLRTSSIDDTVKETTDTIIELTVLLITGQVTAVQILPTREKDNILEEKKVDENWLCDSAIVSLRRNGIITQPYSPFKTTFESSNIIDQQICAAGEKEKSYCNCRAPHSVLIPSNMASPHIVKCEVNIGEYAVHLGRSPDRLSFLYSPDLPLHATVSVVFKSESEDGLLLFGASSTVNTPFRYSAENDVQSARVQVHFSGGIIIAVVCNRLNADVERCYSCSIRQPNGFVTRDWLRVSLFSYDVYHFMTLNEKICHLSPNSIVSDASELYKISSSVSNVLFIGGMYYAKHFQLNRRINDTLRRQLQDNTREKPFSFQGCIAEVRINGIIKNLVSLLAQQKKLFAKSADDADAIFAINTNKFCAAKCSRECHDASCSMHQTSNNNVEGTQCDCALVYRRQDNQLACHRDENEIFRHYTADETILGENYNEENNADTFKSTLIVNESPSITTFIRLSHTRPNVLIVPWNSDNLYHNSALSIIHNRVLHKIWLLLRFPLIESADEHVLLQIGAIQISVIDSGRKVVINIEEYEIRENFDINSAADNRLHLLAVELNAATGGKQYSISVRLDADQRVIEGFDRIPFFPGSDSVQLAPVPRLSTNNEPALRDTGCLAEFVMSFKAPDEESRIYTMKTEKYKTEENYLKRIVQLVHANGLNQGTAKSDDLLMVGDCGIRDSTLWFYNSSEWGVVGDYDPYGVQFDYRRSALSLLFVFLAIILILLILLLIYYCCYVRLIKEKRYLSPGSRYKTNIASNSASFNEYSLSDDKRPLKSDSSYLDSPRNSSSPRSPSEIETSDSHVNVNMSGSSLRVVTTAPTSNFVIVREETHGVCGSTYNNDAIVDEYSSSPKLSGRRHRSKAAILLRRPPDPPQSPLYIAPPQSTVCSYLARGSPPIISQRSTMLPAGTTTTAAVAAAHVATPSPLSKSSYASSIAGLAAPIACQEDEFN